ncbi:MAG: hypothetical protein KKB81_03885 [Candidatus Margulisbacteria bacterium]|nr:hypothetical protein [Candidatus Margulisiibacteriota bacterium]MBU1022013.1 hypothetical protein [Candidatus Margulisiibacteriota bacterium]MBU1729864.1 hypothetical protein [Candidatus Margulisiibacteriota bacterium]MBU1955194.1 hypothetical protein [Candidatus Margulisiibacteriota bacterium]
MKKLILLFLLLVFVLSSVAFAFSTVPSKEANARAAILGKVRVVGNEPFTELVLETKDGDLLLIRENEESDLWWLQGTNVIVYGKVVPAQSRYTEAYIIIDKYTEVK